MCVRRPEDLFTAGRAGTARKGGRPVQEGSRSGWYGEGGGCTYGTAQLQLDSGHAGVIETKWRSSVLLVNIFLEGVVICS